MKILAAVDGTTFSEAILPVLSDLADRPDADVTLLMVAQASGKRRRNAQGQSQGASWFAERGSALVTDAKEPGFIENKSQAIERTLSEVGSYLSTLAQTLPEGTHTHLEPQVERKPADVIIERARAENVDMIVMATHGKSGLKRAMFGSTTQEVVMSGVAPVLIVHPPGS